MVFQIWQNVFSFFSKKKFEGKKSFQIFSPSLIVKSSLFIFQSCFVSSKELIAFILVSGLRHFMVSFSNDYLHIRGHLNQTWNFFGLFLTSSSLCHLVTLSQLALPKVSRIIWMAPNSVLMYFGLVFGDAKP